MEEEYKRLIEEIRDGYFVIQQDRLVLVNNYGAKLYGYSVDEIIGKTLPELMELVPPEEQERLFENYIMRATGQQLPEIMECWFLAKDGSRVLGEVSIWPTLFQGQPAIAGIVRDITERKLIMEKLRDSEEKYRNIVENSPDIIYTADPEGIVHSVNSTVRDMLGYAPEEIIGRKFMDFIPPQAMPRVMEDHNQLCNGDSVASQILSLSKDGIERCFEFRSVPLLKDGIVVKAQGIIRDITDNMKAEEKLNRMFESMTDGVTVTDLNGFITDINSTTVDMHGYSSKDKLLGKNILALIAPCDRQRAADKMQKTMELGIIRDIEYKLLRQDGSEFYSESSVSVLTDVFGKPEGYIAITRDITERKQTEIALKESEELFSNIFYHNPTAMTISTLPEGRILYANDSFLSLLGYSGEELIGHTSVDINFFSELSVRNRIVQELLSNQGKTGKEMVFPSKNGELHTILAWGKEVSINKQPHFIGMIADITERKQTEEKYRQLLEDMNDGYGVLRDGRYVFTNRSFCQIFGCKPGEMIGTSIGQAFAEPDGRRAAEEQYKRVMGGYESAPERQEVRVNKKDGKPIVVEISTKLIRYEGTQAATVIVRDVTDRQQAEEKYRQLLQDMNDGYGVIQDGKYVFVNKRFGEIFQYEPEQIVGMAIDQFIHPESRKSKIDEYEKTMNGSLALADLYEDEAIRSDGKKIIVESTVKSIQYDGKAALGVIIRDITERKAAAEALRESSEMLSLMFECAPYGVAVLDLNAVVIEANDQALKLTGCKSKSEFVGRNCFDFLSKQQQKKALKDIEQCVEKGMVLGFEYTVRKGDKSTVSVQASAGLLRSVDNEPIGLIAIARDITEEKQLRENKQSYIREIIKAQETERKSLARALHDDTVQELLLASHRLQDVIAGNKGRLPKRAQRHLGELRTLIENIMVEVRAFSVDLRPGVLDDMGLIPALRWLTTRLQEGEDIESGLTVQGKERRLPSETELSLFRITQESLSNVRKHAGASTARVTLQFDEKKVMLSIVDNGRGFELPPVVSQFTREHKLGLTGIAERVSLLGGSCKFESSPGKGTAVRVEIDG